jgi:hypothetical protein
VTGPGDGAGAVGAYLLAERLERWELDHPGWSVGWQPDFGYWEALRERRGQVVLVCRASVGELFARVEEVLAAESAGLARRPWRPAVPRLSAGARG